MDLRSLEIFIQVAELGSFTRAGEKLGYSQPTVSFQVKQLERELGVQLFERIGHTVSLTDEGRSALSYAQQICRTWQELALGPNRRRIASGIIRLATADSLCTPLIARRFAEFRADYPNVSLHLTTAGTGELFRLLDHNEADVICILDSPIYNTNYVIASEEKIQVHFIAAASNPLAQKRAVTMKDLLPHPFLLTERNTSYSRLLHERLAKDSIEIHPVLETGNADLICQLVEEDLGISFLPDYVTEKAVQEGTVVRLPIGDLGIELSKQLLYRRDKWVSLQMQAIINHLSKILLQE